MSTLQSPISNPVRSIGGELYEIKASFSNQRKYWAQKVDQRFPSIATDENSDEATKEAANSNSIARNLIFAACLLGNTVDGKWVSIDIGKTADGYLDWEALQDRLAAPEYAPLLIGLNEAWNLAEETTKKAQSLSLVKTEPTKTEAA